MYRQSSFRFQVPFSPSDDDRWPTCRMLSVPPPVRSRPVRLIRRALYALSLAGAIAGLLRVRGKGGVPPQEGGWREIKVPVPVDRPDR